jgi:hypothetical protein
MFVLRIPRKIQIYSVRKTQRFETAAGLCFKELINFFQNFNPPSPSSLFTVRQYKIERSWKHRQLAVTTPLLRFKVIS